MRIVFSNTRSDIMKAQARMLSSNSVFRVVIFLSAVVFAGFGASSETLADAPLAERIVAACVHMAFALLVWVIVLTVGSLFGALLLTGNFMLGERSLTATDEGLVEETSRSRTLHKWALVLRVEKTRSAYLIYVDKLVAHVVPANRPLLEGNLADFIHEVRARLPEHKTRALGRGVPNV